MLLISFLALLLFAFLVVILGNKTAAKVKKKQALKGGQKPSFTFPANSISLEKLKQAIDNYEVLRIHYRGGSRPGEVRDILPKEIVGHLVKAMCFNDDFEKHFAIEKIYLAAPNTKLPARVKPTANNSSLLVSKPESARETTILNVIDEYRLSWEAMGWLVDYSKEHISLHKFGEKGQIEMAPSLSLTYQKFYVTGVIVDPENFDEHNDKGQAKLRSRPWILRGEKLRTNTYVYLDSAAEDLRKAAMLLAPNRVKDNK